MHAQEQLSSHFAFHTLQILSLHWVQQKLYNKSSASNLTPDYTAKMWAYELEFKK